MSAPFNAQLHVQSAAPWWVFRIAGRGFHSEAWQDANPQPRERDREPQDGGGQRRPQNPQVPTLQKQRGTDFKWPMSSLR